jgi:hypothetical protein
VTSLVLFAKYSENDQVEEDEMGRESCTHEDKNAYGVLMGKPERKRLLGRPKRRWEDNVKGDRREM